MRARICDNCHVIIRGPYHKVIQFGGRPARTADLCTKCVKGLTPHPPVKNPEPKPRRLYDIPLDGSPIKVHTIDQNTTGQLERIPHQGDNPPNSSPR